MGILIELFYAHSRYSPTRTGGSVLDSAQRLKQVFIVGHIAGSILNLDEADHALFVNSEKRPLGYAGLVTHAIEINDRTLRIEVREQRERGAHGLRPGAQRVGA